MCLGGILYTIHKAKKEGLLDRFRSTKWLSEEARMCSALLLLLLQRNLFQCGL